MISKLTTGNGFGGSLRYDTRQGRGMKPGLAKVLDVSGVEFDIDEDGNYVINTSQVARDFRTQTMGYQGKRDIRKPVYHWVLSYHPDDKVSEEQMAEDAHDFLNRVGFDDTQYVMIVHYDKNHHHLHIVTNIVNNRGERIPTMGLIDRAHKAAAAITRERGYQWGEKAIEKTIENAHKPHEKVRMLIKPIVKEAVTEARSLEELKTILASKGISCEFTVASDGKRGGISFAYEYEGQLHTFRGSSLDRQLSFGYVKAAIDKNSEREMQRQAEEQEQSKMTELSAVYSRMVSILKKLINITLDLFQLFTCTQQAGISISAETSCKYRKLQRSFDKFHQLDHDLREASDLEIISLIMLLAIPYIGLLLYLIAILTADIRISEIKSNKKELLTKIEGLKSDIDDLQLMKELDWLEKWELLKNYLHAKDIRNKFREVMETIKSEIQKLKEQIRPKIAFDFKAAAQRISTTTTTSQSGSSKNVQSKTQFDLYSLILSAKDKKSLDRALNSKLSVMKSRKDSVGGVTDFEITLAREGRVTTASSLFSEEQMRKVLKKWEDLTGEKPAYSLETERTNRRQPEDIHRKNETISPQNRTEQNRGSGIKMKR